QSVIPSAAPLGAGASCRGPKILLQAAAGSSSNKEISSFMASFSGPGGRTQPTGAAVASINREVPMTMRPDPTFHASPKLAMETTPENFAYTLLLSPDFSNHDALAVIDVKPDSPTFSQIVHTLSMPYKGDEF